MGPHTGVKSEEVEDKKKTEWSNGLENAETDSAEPFGLSEEQSDTDRLLRRLLGTAIADRYADFCRLSSGRLPLTGSLPESKSEAGGPKGEAALERLEKNLVHPPLEKRDPDRARRDCVLARPSLILPG